MKLTPAAVEHLQALLDQPDPKLIKVGVRNRGCSGLAYHLEFVDKPGAFDETVEQDGVKVLIDSKALFSIIGSEMDWVEDKLNQRFVFRNPNISEWLSPPLALGLSDGVDVLTRSQRSNAAVASPSWCRVTEEGYYLRCEWPVVVTTLMRSCGRTASRRRLTFGASIRRLVEGLGIRNGPMPTLAHITLDTPVQTDNETFETFIPTNK